MCSVCGSQEGAVGHFEHFFHCLSCPDPSCIASRGYIRQAARWETSRGLLWQMTAVGRVQVSIQCCPSGTWIPCWKMRLDLLGPPRNVMAPRRPNSWSDPQAHCPWQPSSRAVALLSVVQAGPGVRALSCWVFERGDTLFLLI